MYLELSRDDSFEVSLTVPTVPFLYKDLSTPEIGSLTPTASTTGAATAKSTKATSKPKKAKAEPRPRKRKQASESNLGQREENRRIKHRLIDRARRRREKQSVEELKRLVHLEANERPDKATIVAAAVKTIKTLKEQLNETSSDLPELMSYPSSPRSTSGSDSISEGERKSRRASSTELNWMQKDMMNGLSATGVAVMLIDIRTGKISFVNERFESISGWKKSELVGTRYMSGRLNGRHYLSDPSRGSDFHRGVESLQKFGTWKVISVHSTKRLGMLVQALTTLSVLRDAEGSPQFIMAVSAPDQRRLVQESEMDRLDEMSCIYPQIVNAF